MTSNRTVAPSPPPAKAARSYGWLLSGGIIVVVGIAGAALLCRGCGDLCPNIPGVQSAIPPDHRLDDKGNCVLIPPPPPPPGPSTQDIDRPDIQSELPDGMLRDDSGNSYTDLCPELPGLQRGGDFDAYVIGPDGKCHLDQCRNLPGIQPQVPQGQVRDDAGSCHEDLCADITGIQLGGNQDDYVVDSDGKCHLDRCRNIPGFQVDVPAGLARDDKRGCYADLCPDIPGLQRGGEFDDYVQVFGGKCRVDKCRNLPDFQEVIPAGLMQDAKHGCYTDLCPGISGLQRGGEFDDYVKVSTGQCYIDLCRNLVGVQQEIPAGKLRDKERDCYDDLCPEISGLQRGGDVDDYAKGPDGKCAIDMCPNLPGFQSEVPQDRKRNERKECVLKYPLHQLTDPTNKKDSFAPLYLLHPSAPPTAQVPSK